MIAWYVPVILRIIVAHGIVLPGVKFFGKDSLARRNCLQFLFCFSYALVYAISIDRLSFNTTTFPIVVLGFLNGIGAYCQWQAIRISLSKNALFTFWDDLIAMSLSYGVLGEGQFLNTGLTAGIFLSVSAVILMAWSGMRKAGEGKVTVRFLGYVGTYSVLWGVAVFSMRYFGLQGLPTATFLPCWYAGSFVAAFLLFLRERRIGGKGDFLENEMLFMPAFSVFVLAALGLQYWSFQLAPLIVVQPIFLVSEMVVPALIGLFFFGERKELNRLEKIFFVLGMGGGLLVAISFQA